MSVREKVKAEALKTAARGKATKKMDINIITETIVFDTDLLPHGVKQYAEDIAERMDHAPISFSSVSAVPVIPANFLYILK